MRRRIFSIALMFPLLLIWIPANADQVVPSSRVTSHLNVREQPTVGSRVVGTLNPSESAELVGSVPYWYHIKLHDGTPGYVSKAWSDTIPSAEAKGALIRVGSWNIKKLGHGSSTNFSLVAKVIKENFDILAVVEVMQKVAGHPGYDSLLSTLGSGWAGLITDSPRPNDPSKGSAEFYAILYRPAVIRPCSGWDKLIYHVDNDGSSTGIGEDHFSREPAFGCFEAPVNDTSIGTDFLLAAYHARWAKGSVTKIKKEVAYIGEVFTSMQEARPGEHDLLIAGDFNLIPKNLHKVVTASDRTEGTGSTLNKDGQRTENLYDHLLVYDEDATSEIIGNAKVIDPRNVTDTQLEFYKTVSDHLPIVVRMRTSGSDDD